MQISWPWLLEYIELDWLPEKAADQLTLQGLEVEEITDYEQIKGSLAGVVIGKVLSAEQHPNADRLKVCQVDTGEAEPLQIVCGANNVAVGQKIAVALSGTTLYPAGNGEPITLKKSKIRSIESNGMICAEDELGLGTGHEGIIVLPEDWPTGAPLASKMNLESIKVLTIGLTPNRTDALGHYGVARDLAASAGVKIKLPEITFPSPTLLPCSVKIKIEAPEACPRYMGAVITGVKVQASPPWLQTKLLSVGQRPINNIVDITNFILLELGQPLHAFDLNTLENQQIIVKYATPDLKFITLDSKERLLKANDLLICDAKKPLCIAGIMGGLNLGVTENTTAIFLECAYFSPSNIRSSSSRLGLFSDSAYRFARGIDPNGLPYALTRALNLIQSVAGGVISANVEFAAQVFEPIIINYSLKRAQNLIGKSIPEAEIIKILESLDYKIISRQSNNDLLEISIPTYRTDVSREQDVTEDVLRIYGINNVPAANVLKTGIRNKKGDDQNRYHFQEKLADLLCGRGYREIRTNSLVKTVAEVENAVKMLNPLSEECAVMRQSLMGSGLEVIEYNINRQQNGLKLFEIGEIYSKVDDKFTETVQLAMFLTGPKYNEQWQSKTQAVDFYALKGALSQIESWLGMALQAIPIEQDEELSMGVYLKWGKQIIGKAGEVNKKYLKVSDIKQPVFYACVNLYCLIDASLKLKTDFEELPRFPVVRRDFSMLVSPEITYEEIRKIIIGCNPKLIKRVNLFDVYKPEDSSQTSYAVAVYALDNNKTLEEKDIDKMMQRIIQQLEATQKCTIRK